MIQEEQLRNITTLHALLNELMTKETEWKKERDDALLQLGSSHIANKKLQEEMNNKTKKFEEEMWELQKEVGKETL